MSKFRSIIMRSNRLLGAALVEKNLVTVEQLESATERLLQVLDSGTDREACLLAILINETKAFTETTLLEHLVDESLLALVDLREIDVSDDLKSTLDSGPCWASWTVPFDKDDDVHYVATAYYPSLAVRHYWQKELGEPIIWFGTTLDSIADFLEKLEADRAGLSAQAATN